MNRSIRKRLRLQLKQETSAAVILSLSPSSAGDLRTSLDQIENLKELLDITASPWTSDSIAAISISIAVVVLAGLLWSLKVPHTNISLNADTDNVDVHLAKTWDLQTPITATTIHLDNLSSIRNPSLGLALNEENPDAWIRFEGSSVVIQSLEVDSNAAVDIAASNNTLGLVISGSGFKGTIIISGNGNLTAGTSAGTLTTRPYRFDVPETISFEAPGSPATSSEIDIHNPTTWSLGLLPTSDVDFNYEVLNLLERQVLTGIRSGTLQFNDTSWPVMSLEDQLVSVSDASRARLLIESTGEMMHVSLTGRVSHVNLGSDESRREISPSYLEYLYHKKAVLLFWAAVTGGWGLLWGVRKTIFR